MALADIPGYGAYVERKRQNEESTLNSVRTAGGQLGVLKAIQDQAMAQRVREIMAQSGGDMETAIPALMKAGPAGAEVAGKLALLAEHQANTRERGVKAAEAARKAAFFTPENQAQFVEGAKPAVPASSDGIGVIPEQPAVPGQVNMDRFLQAAATSGVVNPEVYANHVAQQKQRAADSEQRVTLAREKLAQDLQLARERGENQQTLRQMMIAGQRSIHELINANRTPRPLQLTTDAAGNQLIVDPDGTTRPLTTKDGAGVKKPVGADKPMTEFQGKAALYGTRAAQSDKILKTLEDKINLVELAAGQGTGMIGNAAMTSEMRRVSQAQRDFVNAVLRQESGAVISDSEFLNAKRQYFPMAGDDAKTIEQKRANRQLAIQGFARMSGPKGAQDITAIQEAPLMPSAPAGVPPPPPGFQVN